MKVSIDDHPVVFDCQISTQTIKCGKNTIKITNAGIIEMKQD
jgi:hypothetical protein